MLRDRGTSVLLVLFLLGVLAFSCTEIYSFDLGIHLTFGRYIVERAEVPSRNVFSYINFDHPHVNDKWLFQVLIYSLHSLWGLVGLYLVRMPATLGMFYLLWRTLRLSTGPLLAAVLAWAALVVSFDRLQLRPELLSYLLLAAYLFLLERGRVRGWSRTLWLLVPLHLLWVNLHVYHIYGLFLVLAYLVGASLQRKGGRFVDPKASGEAVPGSLWVLALVLVPLALVNPQGLRGALFPLSTLKEFAGESRILLRIAGEFSGPLEDGTGALHLRVFKGMAAVGIASMIVVHRRLSLTHALVFAVFLIQALGMRRNLPFFALAAAPLVARNLGLILRPAVEWMEGGLGDRWGGVRSAATGALALALILQSWWVVSDRFYVSQRAVQRSGFGLSSLTFPRRAVDFVLEEDPEGQVFNSIDAGGYLLWRTYPEKLPFITGDLAGYDIEFLLRYPNIVKARVGFNEVADEYGLGYALLLHTHPHSDPLIRELFDDPGWGLVWLDGVSVVFVRDTPANRSIVDRRRLSPSSPGVLAEPWADPGRSPFDRWVPLRVRPPTEALGLARILVVLEEYGAAGTVLERARQDSPGDAQVLAGLGLVYMHTGREGEAEEILLASVEAGGPPETVRSYLGSLYLCQAKPADALRQFEVGLEASPADRDLALGRAVALRDLGRVEEAIAVLEKVVERDPNAESARLELGSLYRKKGNYYGAARHYSHLAMLRPRDANLHRTLGLIYARVLGVRQKALDHLRMSLELDPEQPDRGEIESEISKIEGGPGVPPLDPSDPAADPR